MHTDIEKFEGFWTVTAYYPNGKVSYKMFDGLFTKRRAHRYANTLRQNWLERKGHACG